MRVRRSANPNPDDPFTLYLVLGPNQRASGSLYWDDGHTLSHREGNYLIREFSYENGVFSSVAGDSSGKFSSNSWIERIVAIGLKAAPTKVTISKSGSTVTQELSTKWDDNTKTLEIRKPIENIKTDVKINFTF